jgi:hypothetical protein
LQWVWLNQGEGRSRSHHQHISLGHSTEIAEAKVKERHPSLSMGHGRRTAVPNAAHYGVVLTEQQVIRLGWTDLLSAPVPMLVDP